MRLARLLPRLVFCLLASSFSANFSFAIEAPSPLWVQFVGGINLNIESARVVADANGGFFLISQSERPLIHFGASGVADWRIERAAGVNDLDAVTDIDVLANGDLIVAMTASGSSPARLFGQVAIAGGMHVARLSSTGGLISLWPVSNGWVNTVKALSDGAFLAAGFGNGIVSIGEAQIDVGAEGFFLVKLGSELEWARVGHSSGGAYDNSILAILADSSGDIFVAGTATAGWSLGTASVTGPGAFLARLDSTGGSLWAQIVATNTVFQAAAKTPGGPVQFLANNRTNGQQTFFSIPREGVSPWEKTLASPAAEIAAGASTFLIGTELDPWRWFIEAFDAQGNSIWRRSDFARGPFFGRSITLLRDGRIAVAASTAPAGIFVDDFFAHDFSLVGVSTIDDLVAVFDPSPNAPPVFRRQPVSYAGIVGERMTLQAGVYSLQPVTFQWWKNHQAIPGENGLSLVRANLQGTDVGEYQLVATSAAGEARSIPVTVTINTVSVTTLAGSGEEGFANDPSALAAKFKAPRFPVALSNSVLVAESSNRVVRRISIDGVTTFAASTQTQSFSPGGMVFQRFSDIGPRLLLADSANNGIRTITLSLDAEMPLHIGNADGGDVLQKPTSVATSEGLSYQVVAEADGTRLWKLSDIGNVLLAGTDAGFVDGAPGAARFGAISGLTMNLRGEVFVCDKGNHAIRKIALDGTVSTFAGTNSPGLVDGAAADARFHSPSGIAVDSNGFVYVTDTGNNAVRRISPAGDVITLSKDFKAPEGVAVRADGTVVVADTGNNQIREIRFKAAASELRVAVSLEGGFAITLSGPSDNYYIESASALSAAPDWQVEAVVFVGDQPTVQPLERPTGTRFYRARLFP